MSGRNQHYVWQMLQRGFLDKTKQTDIVWVYKSDKSIFSTNPRNYGAARDFFTSPEIADADQFITQEENSLAPLVARLRKSDPATKISSDDMSDLIYHLELRSNFIRLGSNNLAQESLVPIVKEFGDQAGFSRLLRKFMAKNPDWLRDTIAKKARQSDVQMLLDYAEVNMSSFLNKKPANEFKLFEIISQKLSEDFPSLIKNAHIKAVLQSRETPKRHNHFDNLVFRIERHDGVSLILPDTSIAVVSKDKIRPIPQKDYPIDAVLIPISSNTIVIGESGKTFKRDTKVLNAILASVAMEGFLTDKKDPTYEKLIGKIGQNALMATKAEVQNLRRDPI